MRRAPRILAALAIGLLAGAFLTELGLRFLLFSDSALARTRGAGLRRAGLYADPWDQDYWRLQHLFSDPERRLAALYDPDTGWRLSDEDREWRGFTLGRRRLVVLYGDSFAGCVTPPEDCWQGQLERSDLGARFALLNRGVGGFGFDQIAIHLRTTIDKYAPYDPVVVVGVLTDDVDRCMLELRNWPRPRTRLEDGRLVSLAPAAEDADTYVAENPVEIRSYLGRFLLYGTRLLPPSWRADPARIRDDARALTVALVREIRDELEQRELDYVFLLFVDRLDLQAERVWQEETLLRAFEEVGVPWVSAREPLLASGEPIDVLFNPMHVRHYTARGNEVVFEALREGLLRASAGSKGPAWSPLGELFPSARVTRRGAGSLARSRHTLEPPFEDRADLRRLVLRPGARGPTAVAFPLDGERVELAADLKPSPSAVDGAACAALTTRLLLDGVEAASFAVHHGAAPVPVRLDLTGALELTIEVAADGPAQACDWVYLAAPRVR